MWIAVTFFLWTFTVSMENPAQIYFCIFSFVFVFFALKFFCAKSCLCTVNKHTINNWIFLKIK